MNEIGFERDKLGSLINSLPAALSPAAQSSTPAAPETQTGAAAEPTPAATAPYPWILHPVIDLLFCCGGLFWLIFGYILITGSKIDLGGSPSAFWLAVISIVGLHLFGDSHQPATLFRVYFSKTTRNSLAKPITIYGVIAMAIGVAILLVPSIATFFLRLVFAWGIQHQLTQSYGIALVYCYKRRYYMTKTEKYIMCGMVNAAITYLILRMFSIPIFGTYSLFNGAFPVPFWGCVPDWLCSISLAVLQLSVVLFAGMVVRKFIKDRQIFPLPAMLTIMTLILMPLFARDAFTTIWFFVSNWWFHSSQYLVVTSAFYFKERGLPPNVSFHQIGRMLFTFTASWYFGLVFSVGFFMFYLVPCWMTEHGIPKAIAFSSIYVAFNLHHFITDMCIWKLRDSKIQKLLVA